MSTTEAAEATWDATWAASEDARLAAWDASDVGKAAWDAWGAATDAWSAAEAACDAAWNAAYDAAWCAAYDAAEGAAEAALLAYRAARAAYLAKTTTPETP